MTAPSAPVITVHTDGDKVYVRWQPVADATDYILYVADTSPADGVEDTFVDDDVDSDGWFHAVFASAGPTYVAVTALNLAAEESAPSNEAHLDLHGPGRSFGTDSQPFG
jgi:Na+-transporting NADH:ubiquinone oxidoreductase subunit NqrB